MFSSALGVCLTQKAAVVLRTGYILLPLHSASEEEGADEKLEQEGRKKVLFFSCGKGKFFYLCTPLRRKKGRLKRGVDGKGKMKRRANKNYFIFYLRKRKSFLPLQSQTKREPTNGVRRRIKKKIETTETDARTIRLAEGGVGEI